MSGDPLAELAAAIEERIYRWSCATDAGMSSRPLNEWLAHDIRDGVFAEALADVPAEALGFEWSGYAPEIDTGRKFYFRRRVNVGSTDG